MRKLASLFFILLLGALFLEILIGFPINVETASDQDRAGVGPGDKNTAEQKMVGVHLVESRAGARDWELFADAAEGYQGKGVWELQKVKVHFYNQESVDFTVTGQQGSIDTKTKDMHIEGNVLTVSANGYRFQSDSVFYNAAKRMIYSPDKVRMTAPEDDQGKGIVVTGQRMDASVDSEIIFIRGDVRSNKNMNSGKKFEIRSDQAEFSGRSRVAKFKGNVGISIDTMKMEGPEAEFQYKNDKNFLESIKVFGGVRVSDVDKFATSESVKFDPQENRFVLSGKPRVVQNNDEMTGDEIVFFDGGKRVKIQNIRAKMDNTKEGNKP